MINDGLPFYCDIVNISVKKSPITNSGSRYECKPMPLMVLLEDFLQWAEIFLSERGSRVYGEVSSHISFYSERLSFFFISGVLPTAQRAALVAGVQLPVYDLVKEKICNSNIVQIKV